MKVNSKAVCLQMAFVFGGFINNFHSFKVASVRINFSNSFSMAGNFSTAFFRPPPFFLIRFVSIKSGWLNSLSPLEMVVREPPVDLETIPIPPCPITLYSAAVNNLRDLFIKKGQQDFMMF